MHEFSYEAPSTIEQAVGLLAAERDGARALCGGTDLLIQMRMGVRTPSRLVDIKGIPDLRRISFDAKTGLKLGGAVPCIEVFENPLMGKHYPGLTEAAHLIGSTQIQSRASVGGNLCNGSPAADSVPALIALRAVAHVVGPKGAREVAVENFVTAPGQTVLQAGELLVELRVPAPVPHSADCYLRMIPRNEMDIAIVGVGSWVTMDGDRCVAARIALGAVGPTQILATKAAESLVGKKLDAAAIENAAKLAIEASKPIDDMRGTAEYRRHIVGVLTRRTLQGAAERARTK